VANTFGHDVTNPFDSIDSTTTRHEYATNRESRFTCSVGHEFLAGYHKVHCSVCYDKAAAMPLPPLPRRKSAWRRLTTPGDWSDQIVAICPNNHEALLRIDNYVNGANCPLCPTPVHVRQVYIAHLQGEHHRGLPIYKVGQSYDPERRIKGLNKRLKLILTRSVLAPWHVEGKLTKLGINTGIATNGSSIGHEYRALTDDDLKAARGIIERFKTRPPAVPA
jgi:hypothetical protein